MAERYREIPFERYADDVICHCRSEAEALSLRQALEARLGACLLELHPQKTKIVYWPPRKIASSQPGRNPIQGF